MRSTETGWGGFALIELIVALVIAGTMLLTARTMLDRLGEGTHQILAAAAVADREANAERLLRELVGRVEVDVDRGDGFAGDESSARFTTWCDTPAGWQERCEVVLEFRAVDHGAVLVVSSAVGGSTPAFGPVTHGSLSYLTARGSEYVWAAEWGDGVRAPIAIGVVMDGDTVILRIGDRS